MLTEARLSKIVSIVNQQKSVKVQQLMEEFQTSESTIRRDLNTLHKRGDLIKVHGGAIAIQSGYTTKDDEVSYRQDKNREDKILIAKYAARLIEEDDFVYLDAGTTTELVIDYIETTNTVFVTNALSHAKKLAAKGLKAYLLGGELKLVTECVVGEGAIEAVSNYNFTKGFFGANGVGKYTGCSTPDTKEAALKKKAISKCREKLILADAAKFDKVSSITFAGFDEVQIITVPLENHKYTDCNNITEVKENDLYGDI